MLLQCGTIITPGMTGDKTYTISNFGGTPKAIIFWSATADGSVLQSKNSSISFGVATAAAQAVIATFSGNALSLSNCTRYFNNSGYIYVFLESTSSPVEWASFVSFGQSGNDGQFTLNYNFSVYGSTRYINYLAIGGDDIEVDLHTIITPSATGTASYAHGLSSKPSTLIGFTNGAKLTSTSQSMFCLGLYNESIQQCIAFSSQHNVGTTQTKSYYNNNFLVSRVSSDGSIEVQVDIDSVDDTNVTLNYLQTLVDKRLFILSIAGMNSVVGSFNTPTSSLTQSISDISLNPNAVFLMSSMKTTLGDNDDANLTLGVCAGSGNISCGTMDIDAMSTTKTFNFQDNNYSLKIYDNNGVNKTIGKLSSLDSNGFTLSYSGVDNSNSYTVAYFGLGTQVSSLRANQINSVGEVFLHYITSNNISYIGCTTHSCHNPQTLYTARCLPAASSLLPRFHEYNYYKQVNDL